MYLQAWVHTHPQISEEIEAPDVPRMPEGDEQQLGVYKWHMEKKSAKLNVNFILVSTEW